MPEKIVGLLLLMIPFCTYGQKVRVTDTQGRAIENVIAIGEDFTTHSDSSGYLVFFPKEGTPFIGFMHPSFKQRNLTWDELAATDFNVVLAEKIKHIDEVTIRPLKRAQHFEDIPQHVVALTTKDAELYQPQTTADLLGQSSEVFIQKSQMGGGSPMIRGFAANRILLVVDGVRMNNAIFRGGNLHNAIGLDVSSLEQTEVILGPGSVIYGSDALGGVIHFYTIKPRLSTSELKTPLRATIKSASANFEKSGNVRFNLGSRKWASATSVSFSDYDDLLMGSRGLAEYNREEYVETGAEGDRIVTNSNPLRQKHTAYSQVNATQKFRYRPGEKADFEYAFHFSRTSDIPRYDRLIQYRGEQLKYAEWYYGPQQWMMHSVKGEFAPGFDAFNNLTVQAAFQDYTESRNDRNLYSDYLRSRTENVKAFNLNIDADKYFSKTQSLFYGFEGLHNTVHSSGESRSIDGSESSEAIAPRYPDASNWWSLAAYVLYNQALSTRLNIQTGARYNVTGMRGAFDQQFYNFPFEDFNNSQSAATVNFGMVLKPNDRQRINLNAATGFRAPNIDDAAKVFDSEPGSVMVPNPSLEAEYASSFEAGFQSDLGANLNLGLNFYYTRLFNAMVRRDGTVNGADSLIYDGEMSKVQMLTNASWANIGGISGTLKYRINGRSHFKSGLSWQTGSDSDGMPVRHVAPLFGNAHFVSEWKKLTLDAFMIFNGKLAYEDLALDEREKTYMYASNELGQPYSPAWYTLNLKARYAFNENFSLNIGLENILDVKYRPYSSGIVAPGMNAIISMNFKL